MCTKYEDISPPDSPLHKLPLLSPQEMKEVLTGVLDDEQDLDEKKGQKFSGVFSELPDLEGDCSILSLGWNDDLTEEGDVLFGQSKDSFLPQKFDILGAIKKEKRESPRKEIECWSKVRARQKSQTEPVPIQKGDLVEYLVVDKEDRIWFLVEVLGRGKAGGKNRNYLNVRYRDGSEGGVFIDKHEWRIVENQEVKEEWKANLNVFENIRLKQRRHKKLRDKPKLKERLVAKCGVKSGDVPEQRNEIKVEPSEDKLEIFADVLNDTDHNLNKDDPASNIKKGDVLEYKVEEAGEKEATWFLVEVLGRGKSGGKNRNYLNIRYEDGSTGGVFIEKHDWRLVSRKIRKEDTVPWSRQNL